VRVLVHFLPYFSGKERNDEEPVVFRTSYAAIRPVGRIAMDFNI
jgi:hypothetical protein